MIDKINDLPTGWVNTTLETIAKWSSGGTPSRRNSIFYNGNIPWIKTGELISKYIRQTSENITEEAIKKSSAKLFPKGSIAIAMYGATIGKLSILDIDATTNQACAVAQPYNFLYNEYLYYFLSSEKRNLINAGKGGAQPNISQALIKRWKFNLPPLNEQKRIVAKIEELFSKLNKGVESLKYAQEQLKIYHQSILKHAFEGKLTEKWRRQNAATLETADELLKKIKQERAKYYERKLQDWRNAVNKWENTGKEGNKPSKPKACRILNLIESEIENSPYFLNNSPWVYEKLGNVVSQFSLKATPTDCPKRPFIGMDCISKNGMKPDFFYTFSEMTSAGNVFHEGQVLYGRLRSYLNKTYLAQYDGIASGEFIILDPIKILNAQYLQLILHAQHFVDWADKQASGDKPRVKYEQIAQYIFAIPSLQEQKQIVSKIEEKFSVINQLEQTISDNLKHTEILRQSILKKAFSGQLVPQDPNDEPTSVLLERIRQEQQAKLPKRIKKKVSNV